MKITKQDENGNYVTYEGCFESFLGQFGCGGVLIAIVVVVELLKSCW